MMQDRPVHAIYQLVPYDLGPLNWWILCAVPDLVQGSRILFDIKQDFDKNGKVTFYYFWINLMYNPLMTKTKP